MSAKRRRKLSIAEAIFWGIQLLPAVLLLPQGLQIRYINALTIYGLVRLAIAGYQADKPD